MKNQLLATLCAGFLLVPLLSPAQAQNGGPRGNGQRGGGQRGNGPRNNGPRNNGPRGDFGAFPPPRFGDFGEQGPPRPRGPRPGDRGQLMSFMHDLDHLDEAGQPLTKAQAGKIVNLVLPWSTKPRMTETEAQKLSGQLQAVLTSAQQRYVRGPRPSGSGRPPQFGPPGGFGQGGPGAGPGGRNAGPGGRGQGRRGPNFGGPGFDGDGFGPPPPPDGFGDGPPPNGPPPDGRPDGPPGFGRPPGGGQPGNRPTPLTEKERAAARAFMENSNPFYPPTGYSTWKTLPAPLQKDVARHYRESRATLEALSRQAKAK